MQRLGSIKWRAEACQWPACWPSWRIRGPRRQDQGTPPSVRPKSEFRSVMKSGCFFCWSFLVDFVDVTLLPDACFPWFAVLQAFGVFLLCPVLSLLKSEGVKKRVSKRWEEIYMVQIYWDKFLKAVATQEYVKTWKRFRKKSCICRFSANHFYLWNYNGPSPCFFFVVTCDLPKAKHISALVVIQLSGRESMGEGASKEGGRGSQQNWL